VESRVALSHETLERPEEQRRVFVAPAPVPSLNKLAEDKNLADF
jgi:hypothetical protein